MDAPPKLPPKRIPPKPMAKPPAPRTRVTQGFSAGVWKDDNAGEKILLYGESGMGKTTLASTAPKPVFIGLDDGGRKLRHPVTGEKLECIYEVNTFADVLAVLSSPGIFDEYDTIVIDTITLLQDLSHEYIFDTIKGEKGRVCRSIEDYGYGKGYRHIYDTMTSILPLLDRLCNSGKNIILIAQSCNIQVANAESEDFIKEGPRLYTGSKSIPSVASAFMEQMDHVLRIGYQGIIVEDKKATGNTERAVFVKPEPWFYAKSRTLTQPVISFEKPDDDSVWRFMLRGYDNGTR